MTLHELERPPKCWLCNEDRATYGCLCEVCDEIHSQKCGLCGEQATTFLIHLSYWYGPRCREHANTVALTRLIGDARPVMTVSPEVAQQMKEFTNG